MLERMTEPTTLGKILARNIASARVARDFDQQDLAARMRELGWKWVRQTVGEVENTRRRLTGEEIFGIALALDTTVDRLMTPLWGNEPVQLPSGVTLPWQSVKLVISGPDPIDESPGRRERHGSFHRGISWDGNSLNRVTSRYDDEFYRAEKP
jgi:transcriptional regulator with XRE-family HTH domain